MKYFIDDLHSDCYIMTEILSTLEYKSGTDRYKLCKTKKGTGSIYYGTTWRGFLKYEKDGTKVFRERDKNNPNRFVSKAKVDYPELEDVFKEFSKLHMKNYKYNTVMINYNYPVGWHYDKANVGESCLITFGDYKGGKTRLDMGCDDFKDLDCRHTPHSFDGSKIKHCVLPFTGDRWALVFFNN